MRMPFSNGELTCLCGYRGPLIWVHGHYQCPSCGQNVLPCCEAQPPQPPAEPGHPPAQSSPGLPEEPNTQSTR